MKNIKLNVNGMMCEGCENRVKNALSSINGVISVRANHKTSSVEVEVDDLALESKIKEKLEDIGYEVVK